MSDRLDNPAENLPGEDPFLLPTYHPNGPNHTLRIFGVLYTYEPALDRWTRGITTMELAALPFSFSVEELMYGMQDGTLHVEVAS
jgi:hypothetical protein